MIIAHNQLTAVPAGLSGGWSGWGNESGKVSGGVSGRVSGESQCRSQCGMVTERDTGTTTLSFSTDCTERSSCCTTPVKLIHSEEAEDVEEAEERRVWVAASTPTTAGSQLVATAAVVSFSMRCQGNVTTAMALAERSSPLLLQLLLVLLLLLLLSLLKVPSRSPSSPAASVTEQKNDNKLSKKFHHAQFPSILTIFYQNQLPKKYLQFTSSSFIVN